MQEDVIEEFHENYKQCKWWFKKNAFKNTEICSWENLSELISTFNSKDFDLVFAKSKKQYTFSQIIDIESLHRANVSKILSSYIKQGYTIILNSAHKWHPPFSRFCSTLGQELNTYTQINLYASWGNDSGAFGTHWDEHDVLIIQLEGTKHWKIFGMTDRNPVLHKYSTTSESDILSEFIMEKGDLLYIPMGQLHSVKMENDISLHATVGIKRFTSLDIFEWLKEEVAKSPEFRQRIPSIKSKDEFNKFMNFFLIDLSKVKWDEEKDIISFEQYFKSKISLRPYLNLPEIGLNDNNKTLTNKKFVVNSYVTILGEHKKGLKIGDGFKKWIVPTGISLSFLKLINGEIIDYDFIVLNGLNNGLELKAIEKICSDMLDEGVVSYY